MPSPKTPQPDHSTAFNVQDATAFIASRRTAAQQEAALAATFDLLNLYQKHNAIRAGAENDTGILIPLRD